MWICDVQLWFAFAFSDIFSDREYFEVAFRASDSTVTIIGFVTLFDIL